MIIIFVVLDFVGEIVEMFVKVVVIYFKNNVEIKIILFVKFLKDVEEVVYIFEKLILCIVILIIVLLDIMESFIKRCYEKNIIFINLFELIIKFVEFMMNVY